MATKQEMLEVVETAINELIANKVASYRIGERTFTYYQLQDLIAWRNQLRRELNIPITVIGDPFMERTDAGINNTD